MTSRKVAFLFPGQGSQHAGMGAELFEDPEVVALAERCSDTVDVRRLLTAADDEELKLTQNAQPALCFAGVALTLLLARSGVEPAAAAGHSVGEYAALAAAGVLSPEDAIRAVSERGRAMAEAVPAGETSMAAVLGMDPDAVTRVLEGVDEAWPANFNTPSQTVIGGSVLGLSAATEKLQAAGARRVIPLNVSAAFHTPFVVPAARRLRAFLDSLAFNQPRIPVISNLSGMPYEEGADFPALLELQLQSAVRWSDGIRALHAIGVTDFVEVGPRKALTGMIRDLAPGAGAHSVATPAACLEVAGLLH